MAYWEIIPNLFISESLHDLGYVLDDITVVVRAAWDAPTKLPDKGVIFINLPLEDNHQGFDEVGVRIVARTIKAFLEEDRRVLVHCAGGRNRSALVLGRTLIEMGYDAEDAITLMREKRGTLGDDPRTHGKIVLHNTSFAEWLTKESQSRRIS